MPPPAKSRQEFLGVAEHLRILEQCIVRLRGKRPAFPAARREARPEPGHGCGHLGGDVRGLARGALPANVRALVGGIGFELPAEVLLRPAPELHRQVRQGARQHDDGLARLAEPVAEVVAVPGEMAIAQAAVEPARAQVTNSQHLLHLRRQPLSQDGLLRDDQGGSGGRCDGLGGRQLLLPAPGREADHVPQFSLKPPDRPARLGVECVDAVVEAADIGDAVNHGRRVPQRQRGRVDPSLIAGLCVQGIEPASRRDEEHPVGGDRLNLVRNERLEGPVPFKLELAGNILGHPARPLWVRPALASEQSPGRPRLRLPRTP